MLDDFVAIGKALSDRHRIRALLALRKGELCLCQLIELLALAPSTVSKHMSILKQAGLVQSRKDCRWVYYRLAESGADTDAVRQVTDLWVALLEDDTQIKADEHKMDAIFADGLDTICKRQRLSA